MSQMFFLQHIGGLKGFGNSFAPCLAWCFGLLSKLGRESFTGPEVEDTHITHVSHPWKHMQ